LILAFIIVWGLCSLIVAVRAKPTRWTTLSFVCEGCGYDLRGLRNPICPECGGPHPVERIHTRFNLTLSLPRMGVGAPRCAIIFILCWAVVPVGAATGVLLRFCSVEPWTAAWNNLWAENLRWTSADDLRGAALCGLAVAVIMQRRITSRAFVRSIIPIVISTGLGAALSTWLDYRIMYANADEVPRGGWMVLAPLVGAILGAVMAELSYPVRRIRLGG
jgi:hypothetical protein